MSFLSKWSLRFVNWNQIRRVSSTLSAIVRDDIENVLQPHQISSNLTELEAHGKDESFHIPVAPQLVTYPETTQQVSEILKVCHESKTPVIPFGSGTSVEGHVAALHGGICMDMSRMNNILEIYDEDFCCRAEAGVRRLQLNEALKLTGLFFSVDPGADATLGGMVSTRASGTNTVRFGTMRENLLGCTAVLANGDIIKTGSKAAKSSAGYDLTHLLCGSEGTLAVITEVLIRLHPYPESIAAAVCEFDSIKTAVDSAAAIIQHGISVARLELLDELSISAVNAYSKMNLTPCPTLFLEFHGTKEGLKEESEKVSNILKEFGGSEFRWETTTEGRYRLWKARHSALWALMQAYPNCKGFITDVCVPISKLTECVVHAQETSQKLGIPSPIVGHVGDGNFHSLLMVDPQDLLQIEKAKNVSDSIVHQALACGGTCTGEHGIGHGKLKYLEKEHGKHALSMMHRIKQAFDPHNILNPGKLGSFDASTL